MQPFLHPEKWACYLQARMIEKTQGGTREPAVTVARAFGSAQPNGTKARDFLSKAHQTRAQARALLSRDKESLDDWNQALALADPMRRADLVRDGPPSKR